MGVSAWEATMAATPAIGASDVLLVVDIQNDFCPGGRLAVPKGDDVVPLVNRLAQQFSHVVLTQDWHPAGHRVVRLGASGQTTVRDHFAVLWSASAMAGPLRPRQSGR